MNSYSVFADLVAVIHFALVVFIVFGLPAIILGFILRWRWVRNFYFRAVHLLMIAFVALESVLGVECFLTTWEDDLREMAGETALQGSFIARMIHKFLFWDVPPSVMGVMYCVFFLLVLVTLVFIPPRRPWKKEL
jgi:hypothetical protein